MRTGIISRSVIILACAAIAAAVYAQWGWSDDDGPSEASWGSSESSASSPDPYDVGSSGGSSSDGSFSDAFGGSDEQEQSAARPQRERAQKAPRAPRERAASGSAKFSGPQKTCPVCNSVRLKNNLFAVGGGRRIHVCSEACLHRVRRNPAPFAARIEKRGEQLAGQ